MKSWRNKRTHDNDGDCFYDLYFDEKTIAASIAKTYGILPSQQEDLQISDFFLLISGLDAETPLAYLIRVRKENDPAKVQKMTGEELRIREEWREFKKSQQRNTEKQQRPDAEYAALLQFCNIKTA